MIFNLVWLPARQTGSSTRTKVLLRIMLRDTTVCEDDLVKQALRQGGGLLVARTAELGMLPSSGTMTRIGASSRSAPEDDTSRQIHLFATVQAPNGWNCGTMKMKVCIAILPGRKSAMTVSMKAAGLVNDVRGWSCWIV